MALLRLKWSIKQTAINLLYLSFFFDFQLYLSQVQEPLHLAFHNIDYNLPTDTVKTVNIMLNNVKTIKNAAEPSI